MTTPLVRDTMRELVDAGVDIAGTYWFDISALPHEKMDQIWLTEHRPPFDKCMVLWHGSSGDGRPFRLIMYVSGTDPEAGIVVSIRKTERDKMPWALPPMFYTVDEDSIRYGPVHEDKEVPSEMAELMLYMVASWYQSLAQGTQAYIPEVRDTFTNRRKIKQGKAPLYDWRTVVITPCKPQPASQHKGGTHASPRQHDRRGHLRHLRNGKNVWVRPCKVGDPSKGTVFHDYEVRTA